MESHFVVLCKDAGGCDLPTLSWFKYRGTEYSNFWGKTQLQFKESFKYRSAKTKIWNWQVLF